MCVGGLLFMQIRNGCSRDCGMARKNKTNMSRPNQRTNERNFNVNLWNTRQQQTNVLFVCNTYNVLFPNVSRRSRLIPFSGGGVYTEPEMGERQKTLNSFPLPLHTPFSPSVCVLSSHRKRPQASRPFEPPSPRDS